VPQAKTSNPPHAVLKALLERGAQSAPTERLRAWFEALRRGTEAAAESREKKCKPEVKAG
jgi:hypothetical protein